MDDSSFFFKYKNNCFAGGGYNQDQDLSKVANFISLKLIYGSGSLSCTSHAPGTFSSSTLNYKTVL